jgi:hypothetical protein
MADAVATNVLQTGTIRKILSFTNVSDGTGESGVNKVDISALNNAPTKVKINRIWWSVSGLQVRILFDHDTDDTALILDGSGHFDFRSFGGFQDPASAGGTGDILFTTLNYAANDSYTVILEIEWQ